jgi:hypothetical protein
VDRSRLADIRGIVFTDMVGSSRLGDDRADDLRRAHDTMLGSVVAAHGRKVVGSGYRAGA